MRHHLHLITSILYKSCGGQWKRQQLCGGKMVAYTHRKDIISIVSTKQEKQQWNWKKKKAEGEKQIICQVGHPTQENG